MWKEWEDEWFISIYLFSFIPSPSLIEWQSNICPSIHWIPISLHASVCFKSINALISPILTPPYPLFPTYSLSHVPLCLICLTHGQLNSSHIFFLVVPSHHPPPPHLLPLPSLSIMVYCRMFLITIVILVILRSRDGLITQSMSSIEMQLHQSLFLQTELIKLSRIQSSHHLLFSFSWPLTLNWKPFHLFLTSLNFLAIDIQSGVFIN